MKDFDFVVIGAGIAGASAAYELAAQGSVLLLERESAPGYHSTGRSAAVLTENYGLDVIRKLTVASRAFLAEPPNGFVDQPLLSPRGVLWLARQDQVKIIEKMLAPAQALVPSIHLIDAAEARALCHVLRPDYVAGGLLEPDAMDIDVAALHQGYLRGLRQRGGRLRTEAEVRRIARAGGGWSVETASLNLSCSVLVNAAGAWCDVIAEMAGVEPIGLVPKRRTAFVFDGPAAVDAASWPIVIDADEKFYFKPESGRIMGSPADETPMPPCDVQPEELDIAQAIDRIQRATSLNVERLRNKWAGLRSFAPDRAPVVGMDHDSDGFFWLAGQGGYGIMTSPAMARATAGLIADGDLPQDLQQQGLRRQELAPDRLRRAA